MILWGWLSLGIGRWRGGWKEWGRGMGWGGLGEGMGRVIVGLMRRSW